MQQQARDEAGNIWELDAAGNPVRLVQPVAQQGRVFSLPPNPKEVRQEAHQVAADERAAADQRLQADEAHRKALEWNATHNPDGSPKTGGNNGVKLTAAERTKALAQLNAARNLDAVIADLKDKYKDGPGATSGIAGVTDFLPTEGNKRFDKAASGARGIVRNALGLTGGEANTAAEAQMNLGAYIPDSSNYDSSILDTIGRLQNLRDNAHTMAIQVLGGEPDKLGNIHPDEAAGHSQQRADNEVPNTTGAQTKDTPNLQAATGDTRVEYDQRTGSMIDSLINSGASKATVDAVLKRKNQPAVTPGEWSQIQSWRKQNPDKPYYGASVGKEVPLNAFQKLAGSPLGAGAARFANSATAGLVGAVAGDKGKGALDAMAAAYPGASLAGDLAGGVAGAFGAEAGAAAALGGRGATWLAPRIADAGYGALSGFNAAEDGSGVTGALEGAGAGLAGGMLGHVAGNAIGSAFRGVQSPAVRLLRDRGVPMTVGQVAGDSGNIGRSVKGVEDALTSIPGVGSVINARRMESLGGFNRAAFETAGAPSGVPVTATGADGIQQLRQGVGQAYDNALAGTQINTNDPAFLADMQNLVTSANAIPPVNGAREAAATALDARILGGTDPATGMMPGRNFQEAYRGLARTGRERANGDYGHEIGQVMRQGQDALASALETQNPGAFTAFRAANSTNRNANVLADAVHRAKSAEAELFTPAQLNMADTGSARRLTGPLASASGERPFYDLATAGQSVLPSKLPDSGTATRGLVAAGMLGGLTGGGAIADGSDGAKIGGGIGLGTALLLTAGGSRPAQHILTSALLDRPDLAVDIGNALRANARLGGRAGAGILTPLTVSQ